MLATMESETDSSSQSSQPIIRLGLCEVCAHDQAKYTCPKCEVKTCCLRCLNVHKRELDCTGIRDKTRFIPIRDMTRMDFISDYTFLEECTRYVADRKRDKLKRHTRYNKSLPAHLFKLRGAAHERRTALRFLLALFSRHAANTTFYDWKTRVIWWRVQWVFPNAANVTFSDRRCDERLPLQQLLGKYVDEEMSVAAAEAEAKAAAATTADDVDDGPPQATVETMRKSLEFYRSRGVAAMRVLLKAEGIKRSRTRFWELDVSLSLRDNLAGKTIVEFPVVYVMYDDVVKEFDVIDSDEDIAAETELYQRELKANDVRSRPPPQQQPHDAATESGVTDNMRDMQLKRRRRDERRAKRARQAKVPQNLLFGGDDGDDAAEAEDSSSAEESDGNETEEELEAEAAAEREGLKTKETSSVRIEDDTEDYEQVGVAKRAKLAE